MTAKSNKPKSDSVVKLIREVLSAYQTTHKSAHIDVYRLNSVSVRIRIIDPKFKGMSLAQRDDIVWEHLNQLPDRALAEISLVLLFSPDEARHSLASLEFDEPISH